MAKKTKKHLKNIAYLVSRNKTKQEVVNVIFPNGLTVGVDDNGFANGFKVHGNAQVAGTLNAGDVKINGTSVSGGGTAISFEPPTIAVTATIGGRVSPVPATAFTKVSISSSSTFTWGGHNAGRAVTSQTSYEIISANITGICDNSSGTTLTATVSDAGAEGDENYVVDLKNSSASTILRFAVTKDSGDAKLLVTSVGEHATGTEDWTTCVVTVPIKTATATTNKTFTFQKNPPGATGTAGEDAFTIFSTRGGYIEAGTVASNAAVTNNASDFVLIKGQRANTTIAFNGNTAGAEGTTADRFALDVETNDKVTGKSYATDGSERDVHSTWNSGGSYIELRDNSTSGTILAKLTVSDTGNDAKLLLTDFATQCNSKDLQSIHVDLLVDVYVNDAAVTGYVVSLTIAKNIPGADGAAGDDGDAGPATPDFSFTNPIINIDTDDTGGALDDGGDLSSADISSQAFAKADVSAGTTNVTFAGHGLSGAALAANNTYRLITNSITAVTDNGTNVAASITTSSLSGVGDTTYDIYLNNAAGDAIINLDITSDSSDLKILVGALAEHESGTDDYNSIKISVPLRMQTAAGTQTITRVLTVQKIRKGTTGTAGSDGTDAVTDFTQITQAGGTVIIENPGATNYSITDFNINDLDTQSVLVGSGYFAHTDVIVTSDNTIDAADGTDSTKDSLKLATNGSKVLIEASVTLKFGKPPSTYAPDGTAAPARPAGGIEGEICVVHATDVSASSAGADLDYGTEIGSTQWSVSYDQGGEAFPSTGEFLTVSTTVAHTLAATNTYFWLRIANYARVNTFTNASRGAVNVPSLSVQTAKMTVTRLS